MSYTSFSLVQCKISTDDKSLYLFHSFENDALCREGRLNVRFEKTSPCLTIDYRTFRFNGLGHADQEQTIHCTLALENTPTITTETVIPDCTCKNKFDCDQAVPTTELAMSGAQELSVEWSDDLNDSESELFKETAENFEADMKTLLESSDDVVEATVTVQSFSQSSDGDYKRRRRSGNYATATFDADLVMAAPKSANEMGSSLTDFLENIDATQLAAINTFSTVAIDGLSVTTRSEDSEAPAVPAAPEAPAAPAAPAPSQAPYQSPSEEPTPEEPAPEEPAPEEPAPEESAPEEPAPEEPAPEEPAPEEPAPEEPTSEEPSDEPIEAPSEGPAENDEDSNQAVEVPNPQPYSVFKERLDLINTGILFR